MGDLPPGNAIQGGFDNGPSYHARGVVSGKTIPGKAGVDSPVNGRLKGACFPYGSKEHRINDFEVLTSEWKTSYVKCKTGNRPPKNAVQGGYDGGPSYHARGIVDGKIVPGKVGVTREHDGNLLGACIAYGGKEHRINNFEVLVIDDAISHVEFQVDESKILSTAPKVIARQKNNNDTSVTQSMEFSCSETIRNSFTFTHQFGASVSVGTKMECGLPMVAGGGVNVKVSGSYSYTWGKSGTTEQSFVAKFPVNAGPHSTVVSEALVNETKLEVPYTVFFKSGNTSRGMWHGTSCWGLQSSCKEVKE